MMDDDEHTLYGCLVLFGEHVFGYQMRCGIGSEFGLKRSLLILHPHFDPSLCLTIESTRTHNYIITLILEIQ